MTKRSTKQKTENKKELVSAKNVVRGARDGRQAISRARLSLLPEQFGEFLSWLRSNPTTRRLVNPELPRSARSIDPSKQLKSLPALEEIRWAVAYVLPYANELRRFINRAQAFQRAFLIDDYEAASSILEELEQHFGQSLWLIKRRITLLQAAQGLEAQKQYIERLRNKAITLADFIAFFVSISNEPSVTPRRFYNQAEATISAQHFPPSLDAYVRFHIIPGSSFSEEMVADILCIEQAGALVDYYEALVSLARSLTMTMRATLPDDLLRGMIQLYTQVGDTRLGGLMTGLGLLISPELPNAQPEVVESWNAWLTGDYINSAQLAARALEQNPSDSDAIVAAARAAAMLDSQHERVERPMVQRLIQRIATILTNGPSAVDDTVEVTKRALIFFGEPWSNAVLGLVRREITTQVHTQPAGTIHLAALSALSIHPAHVLNFPPGESRSHYANLIKKRFGDTTAAAYAAFVADTDPTAKTLVDIVWEERELLSAMRALERHESEHALNSAQRLSSSSRHYYQRRALRILCHALLDMGRTEECVKHLTNAYVKDRSLRSILPLAEAIEALSSIDIKPLAGNIMIPIARHINMRHVNRKADSECMDAYLDFLDAHGIQRASEIGRIRDRFDRPELIYFLQFICVESVMDRSNTFSNSRALLEERLAICRLLVELDETSFEEYQTEIKALLRRLMLQRRIQEVEQSKIFVDTESIKRTVAEDMRETFNRFMAMKRERSENNVPDLPFSIKKVVETIQGLANLTLPGNETFELFASMVVRLRDEYASSPDHGLDKYLSVRIRHGTLAAHLRKPVDAVKLVTTREVGSSSYKTNEHWLARLRIQDQKTNERIAERLAKFSSEFDQLVDEVKSWIHVRTPQNEHGLFDFNLSDPSWMLAFNYVTQDFTFDKFVEFVLGQLGQELDRKLLLMQARLTTNAKVRATDILARLEVDIARLAGPDDTREIVNAIRTASTELQVAFDRVSAWFQRANAVANEPIPMRDVVEISVKAVRTVAPSFDAQIEAPEDPAPSIHGRSLAIFTDIFFIIFENIAKHAKLISPTARVALSTSEDKEIHVCVENELGPKVVSADAQTRLLAIKGDVLHDRNAASVSREGGTGFYKLGKLLTHDLGLNPQLDFGFSDDNRFYVRFTLRAKSYEDPASRG